MQFAYTICYVDSVADAVTFFTEGLGLELKMRHESGDYAELATGSTTLSLAARSMVATLVDDAAIAGSSGFEIALATDDVPAAVSRAVAAGATLVRDTEQKLWGQVVAYVRSPGGVLLELCTPMG